MLHSAVLVWRVCVSWAGGQNRVKSFLQTARFRFRIRTPPPPTGILIWLVIACVRDREKVFFLLLLVHLAENKLVSPVCITVTFCMMFAVRVRDVVADDCVCCSYRPVATLYLFFIHCWCKPCFYSRLGLMFSFSTLLMQCLSFRSFSFSCTSKTIHSLLIVHSSDFWLAIFQVNHFFQFNNSTQQHFLVSESAIFNDSFRCWFVSETLLMLSNYYFFNLLYPVLLFSWRLIIEKQHVRLTAAFTINFVRKKWLVSASEAHPAISILSFLFNLYNYASTVNTCEFRC